MHGPGLQEKVRNMVYRINQGSISFSKTSGSLTGACGGVHHRECGMFGVDKEKVRNVFYR
jgi:hypothetical protein